MQEQLINQNSPFLPMDDIQGEISQKLLEEVKTLQIPLQEQYRQCKTIQDIIELNDCIVAQYNMFLVQELLPDFKLFEQCCLELKDTNLAVEQPDAYPQLYDSVLKATIYKRQNQFMRDRTTGREYDVKYEETKKDYTLLVHIDRYHQLREEKEDIEEEKAEKKQELEQLQSEARESTTEKSQVKRQVQSLEDENFILRFFHYRLRKRVALELAKLEQLTEKQQQKLQYLYQELGLLSLRLSDCEKSLSRVCGFSITFEQYEERLTYFQTQRIDALKLKEELDKISILIDQLDLERQELKLKELCEKTGISTDHFASAQSLQEEKKYQKIKKSC